MYSITLLKINIMRPQKNQYSFCQVRTVQVNGVVFAAVAISQSQNQLSMSLTDASDRNARTGPVAHVRVCLAYTTCTIFYVRRRLTEFHSYHGTIFELTHLLLWHQCHIVYQHVFFFVSKPSLPSVADTFPRFFKLSIHTELLDILLSVEHFMLLLLGFSGNLVNRFDDIAGE